jgi:hypothetical protein
MEIHPNDYIFMIDTPNSVGCVLGFQANQDNYWVLGSTFLRGYYSVHDMKNDRLGFGPNKNSKKINILKGSDPRQNK